MNNFGPHEHYDVDTDASIIGLSGTNGAGKSNFLSAVEFGFRGKTGDSDETLASFIREGANKASVKQYFRKDGNIGIIEREIKPSSSTRTLTWMGSTYTKDAEVKSRLNEILGVDEFVLQNAVFIQQGQLDKLLFGTPTEREEMFIKMMLMGYMAKVSDTADQKAMMLARTVQDVSVLKDELTKQQAAAEQQLASVETALTRCPDMTRAITQWNTICTYSSAINMHVAEASAAYDIAMVSNSNVHTLLSEYSSRHKSYKVIRIEELEKSIAEQKSVISTYNNSVNVVSRGIGINSMLQSYSNDLDMHLKELQVAKAYALAANKGLTDETLAISKNELAKAEVVNTNYVALRDAEKVIVECHSGIAENKPEIQKATKARDAVSVRLEVVEQEGRDLQVKLDTLKAVLSSTQGQMSHCPLCEQAFTKSRDDLESMRSATAGKHTDKKQEWIAVKTEFVELDTYVSGLEKAVSAFQSRMDAAMQTVDKLRTTLAGTPEVSAADMQKLRDCIVDTEAGLRKQQALQASLSAAEYAVRTTESKLNAISEEDKQQAKDSTPEVLAALKEDVRVAEALLADTESCYKAVVTAEKTRVDALDTCTRHKAKESEIRSKLSEEVILPTTQNIIASVTAEFPECENDKTKLRALVSNELATRQSEHEQTKGSFATAKKHANEAVKRLTELEKREEMNAEILKIVEELKSIKDAFSRKGIPRAYINYYYDRLLISAQNTLEAMDANFSIQPHPTKPVSLQFRLNGQPGDSLFDQSKLSGGQRVRVTLAFLLAVQRLLVPELGFLSLDEPSMHIHPEGQEAMRDMLVTLGAQMANGEAQIWISDHSDIIAMAYDKTIKLKSI